MSEAVRADNAEGGGLGLATLGLGACWAGLVAIVLTALSAAGYTPKGPDEWTYDWRTLIFSRQAEAPRSDIAIVLINEDSMAEYDYVSPVDRGLVAKLLEAIDAAGPRAIGVDFIYDRRSEAAKTEALIDTFRSLKSPVVFGAIDARVRGFKPEDLQYQEDFIARTGRDAGHVFFARDTEALKIADQVVRYMGERSPAPPHRKSITQLLAEKAGASPQEPASPYIAWLLPPPGSDLFPLFRVPRHAPDAGPEAVLPQSWRAALKGKIVLVGGDFVDRDKHLTPLSIWDQAKMPGVAVQAQILAQLIDGRSIHEVGWQLEAVLLSVVALAGFLLARSGRLDNYDWIIYFGGLAGLMLLGVLLFSTYAVIIPSATLFFAWTAGVTGGHYAERAARRLRLA